MDKTGLITLIIGIVLLLVGIAGIWFFFPAFVEFIKGGIGLVLALIGAGAIVLGILMLKE